jgi:hypothetical protein
MSFCESIERYFCLPVKKFSRLGCVGLRMMLQYRWDWSLLEAFSRAMVLIVFLEGKYSCHPDLFPPTICE